MPVYHLPLTDPLFRAGVWHITETEDELAAGFIAGDQNNHTPPAEIRHPRRRLQWLACRRMAELLTGQPTLITTNPDGKPTFANGKGWLSLSHTGSFAAAAVCGNRPVGIDIEMIRPRILKVLPQFLQPNEINDLLTAGPGYGKHYVYWGGKEAIYKLYGTPETDFRNDITIHPFDYLCIGTGKASAVLQLHGQRQQCELHYETLGELMLVVATLPDEVMMQ